MIIFAIEIIGTIAFAISGVRLARRREYDLFGGFVLAWSTAVGGGTLRDIMLGQTPFWMTNIVYILCTMFAMLLVFLANNLMDKMDRAWLFFDTLGLALFTIAGIQKTIICGQPIWVSIMMGCITGVAGGLFRDLLAGISPIILKKDLYAMVSILGGCLYFLLLYSGVNDFLTSTITFLFIVTFRLVAVKKHIELPRM